MPDTLGRLYTQVTYVQSIEEWNHDHCVGCWQKFTENGEAPEMLQIGTVMDADAWVCPTCFANLGLLLRWSAQDQTT